MESGRGRKLGRRQESKESRDSSVSSTSREVRCGCQYFQSDSLLPERQRHTLVGTRPSSRNMGDHEYEPINPPTTQPPSPPLLKVEQPSTDQEDEEKSTEPERIDFTAIIIGSEHQYLRIPLDKDLVIPIDKEEIESIRYDDEEETEQNAHQMTVHDIQNRMEERLFSATPTTTISRTDGEFNTSQMDSSGLDELPLKRDARKGFNTKGFQQRLQSQAGRLRTRIRNISRPKINFPERPKFNLPERPKFNLPERPKFNIKRPDIKMPNFSFGKTKTSSIRRPLRDKSQHASNQSTAGSKKNIFDSINFRTYPRIFSKKKKTSQGRRAMTPPPRMETESSPPSSPVSRTGTFHKKWTQRFKDIKFADDNQSDIKKPSFDDDVEDDSAPFREPSFPAAVALEDKKQMKSGSSASIPGSDREQQSSGSSSERHRAGVIEEIDSDEFFLREKGLSREDVDVSRYLSLEIRDAFRSPKNALARLDGDLYDDDDDDDNEGYEFNSHQRPLGEPLRLSMEAIRKRSLEQLRMTPERDIEYQGELEDEDEPVRPERTRSLKKQSTRSESRERKSDENQFDTYPPNRPSRSRKQSIQSKQSIPIDDYNEKESIPESTNLEIRQPSIPSLAVTDTTKEFTPTRYIDESSEALNEPWLDEPHPPLPPKRRKSIRDSSQENGSVNALNNYNKENWLDDEQGEDIVLNSMNALDREDQNRLVQNGYYDSPPPVPIRKSRSRGTSLADEDRTSRGADSLISETRTHLTEDIDVKPDIISDNFDYAQVEKTVIENKSVQKQAEKPARPPPPNRKKKTAAHLTALKNQSINFFFTYPRRAIKKSLHKQSPTPIRPVRNYSTIGPARPPRRNRVFREPVYEGEFIPLRDDNEITTNQDEQKTELTNSEKYESAHLETLTSEKTLEKSDTDPHDTRDLQAGEVIEKMKGRPLPPPPRPPRKPKDDSIFDYYDDEEQDQDIQVTDLDDEDEVIVERINILIGHSHENIKSDSKENDISQLPTDYCDKESESQRHLGPVESVQEPWEKAEESLLNTEVPPITAEEPPIKTERRKKSLSVTKTLPLHSPAVETSVSTQTDSLPEGFYVEEEQQTTENYKVIEDQPVKKKVDDYKETEREKKVETIVEHKVVVIPTPETEILKTKKIHVEELDVEKLNVTELQAKKITVSDIDGVSMQVAELSSKSGHLVISGFELPSSFLEAITPPPPPAPIIQIQSSTQTPPEMTDSQTNTSPQEETQQVSLESRVTLSEQSSLPQPSVQPQPSIPQLPFSQKRPSPPPSIVIQTPQGHSSSAYVAGYIPSSPPPRPHRTRSHGNDSEEDLRILPRRRRHHSQKHSTQYSSDEDEEEYPSHPIVRRAHHHDPTSTELIRQLFNIWQASAARGLDTVVQNLNSAFPEGEKRKDAQTAACIILVLLAGLIMLGFGSDKTVHHHHWDFLPPHP